MFKIFSTPVWGFLLLLAGIGWNAPSAQAQAIAFSYVFDGQVLTGTSSQPGATANNATYGAGLGIKTFYAGNPGDAMAGDGFAAGTPLNTANNDYLGFSFTAAACSTVTLTNVSFDARRSGTGPANLEVRYSVNGFASGVFSATISGTSFESKSGALANLVVAAGQTVEFRLYGFNASGTTGTLRIDNVRFSGTIAASVPTIYTVTGGGAICPPEGALVGLSGSQLNVNYQLRLNGSPIGVPVGGTGAALNFGNQTGLGTYTVVATNANGCTSNQAGIATISQSSNCGGGECSVGVEVTPTNARCHATATGAINLTPNGGTLPYTYLWSNGATVQDPTGLLAGNYTVTVTDANNCTRTISATIAQPAAIVLTSVPVNVVCNATGSIDLSVNGGTPDYAYDWSNGASTQDISNLSAGTYTVTVTDANACTATRSNTLSSVDVVKPSIVCPANTTIEAGANCASAIGNYPPVSVSDNCTANPAVTQSPAEGAVINGANPTRLVILTATDEAGNTQSCQITVSLVDGTAPVLECPANQTVQADADCSGLVGQWTPVSVGDNCSANVSVVQSPEASTVLNGHNDTETIAFTATDAFNNTQTCIFTVTLNDVTPPTMVCPDNVTLYADDDCSVAIGAYAPITLNDYCTAQPTITQDPVAEVELNGHNASSVVTLTATDEAGNTQTCALTVTLKDVTPPTIVCQPFVADLNANGVAHVAISDVYESGFDNCGEVVVYGVFPNTFYCNNIGDNAVRLATSDEYGNRTLCTTTVTVRDAMPPTAKCKDVTANIGPSGSISIAASSIGNGTTDNCGFTVMIEPSTFDCSNIGLNTVTLTATDAGGNTATCTATVRLEDKTGPVARCNNPTIYVNDIGQATLSVEQVNNGSNDACGIASMSINETQFNCSNLPGSSWPVTLTLTDVHGNTSSCLANVTVKDALAPTAVCSNVTVALGPDGRATVYSEDLALNSFDNCSVWSFSPIAKIYTAANLGNNNLTVTVKDWSGNASTCVSMVTVILPANGDFQQGGDEKGGKKPGYDVVVYPNPAHSEAIVAFQLPAEQKFEFRLFDASGRMVYNQKGIGFEGENVLPLTLEGFESGIYWIDFQSENQMVQQRLIINK